MTRRKNTAQYLHAIAWIEANGIGPGPRAFMEEGSVAQEPCVIMTAAIFNREPVEVAHDVIVLRKRETEKEEVLSA